MILVTGATGHFGKAAIEFLLKQHVAAGNIAALVRDSAKGDELKSKGIDIRIGDYENHAALVKAFTGVDKLLLISSNVIEGRAVQHKNAIDAAVEAGVKYVVYTSFLRKNESETSPIAFIGQSHLATEEYLKQSGLKYTILKNTLYADVLPLFMGEQVLERGIYLPAGETKASFATREDMAEATAKILSSVDEPRSEYAITGSESYSLNDVAVYLTAITGKQVAYINPTLADYTAALTQANAPAELIGMLTGFSEAIKQGEFEATSTDLETLLGRKPTGLKAYLESVYGVK